MDLTVKGRRREGEKNARVFVGKVESDPTRLI